MEQVSYFTRCIVCEADMIVIPQIPTIDHIAQALGMYDINTAQDRLPRKE